MHSGVRIETPGTCAFNIHSPLNNWIQDLKQIYYYIIIYLCIYLSCAAYFDIEREDIKVRILAEELHELTLGGQESQ